MKARILIAEDDPAMCHVLSKTLSQIPGVEVLGEANDGITALTMVEKLNPRVVLSTSTCRRKTV